MPIDQDGNRAEFVMDGGATLNRMNLGRVYEQFINATSRDLVKELRSLLGGKDVAEEELINNPMVAHAWSRLMRYYQIVSPRMHRWMTDGTYTQSMGHHLKQVMKEDVLDIYYPPENETHPTKMIELLSKEFPSTYGPVLYQGNSGLMRKTKFPVRIGSLYILLLEKTGDDWTALSSGKWQNFGVLAQITTRDKFALPTRAQSIRAFGETEIRILDSYIGPILTAELQDRNNSITTHKQVLDAILSADKPTNILNAVDRTVNPLGNARPLQLVKHLAQCGGWRFAYKPHVAPQPQSSFTAFE